MSPETAKRVLRVGGHLRIKKMSPDTLTILAPIAKEQNVMLQIVGGLSPDTMVSIATAGGGYVLFDTSED